MTITKPMSRCDSSVSIRPFVWSASMTGMLSCWMNCSTASLDGSLGPWVTKRTLFDDAAAMACSLFGEEAGCGFLFDFEDLGSAATCGTGWVDGVGIATCLG